MKKKLTRREKVRRLINAKANLNGMTCAVITRKIAKIEQWSTIDNAACMRRGNNVISAILAKLVKDDEVVISEGHKGPRGGKMYFPINPWNRK